MLSVLLVRNWPDGASWIVRRRSKRTTTIVVHLIEVSRSFYLTSLYTAIPTEEL